jgi:hypothetical protein
MGKLQVKERYGTVPNEILNNESLSFRAKGLYAYIQSKPDDWDFSSERIAAQSKDGRDSVRAALIELEDAFLLRRIPVRNPANKKIIGFDYILYASPYKEEAIDGFAVDGFPNDGIANDGKSVPISNKEYSKKEISKKEKERDGGEKSFSDEETFVATPNTILADLASTWLKAHPSYREMADPIQDLPAIRKIAEKIMRTPHFHSNPTETIIKFKHLCKVVLSDEFWQKKSLKSISNNIQEFLPLISASEQGRSLTLAKKEKPQIQLPPQKINLDTYKNHVINGGAVIKL